MTITAVVAFDSDPDTLVFSEQVSTSLTSPSAGSNVVVFQDEPALVLYSDDGAPADALTLISTIGPQGPRGADGADGAPGLRGPTGQQGPPGTVGTSVVPVFYTQDVPSADWVIPHSFGYNPDVTVIDSAGRAAGVEIIHTPGVVTIHAELAFAGQARLI